MTSTILEAFSESCARHGARTAVVGDDGRLAYTALAAAVDTAAGRLSARLPADCDRIGILSANAAAYVVGFFAAMKVGVTPFLLDPALGPRDLRQIVASCGLRAFLHAPGVHAALTGPRLVDKGAVGELDLSTVAEPTDAAIPPLDGRTGACRFTSGTTGAPKCLEFAHDAVVHAAANWVQGTGLCAEDRVLCLATFANGLAFNTSLLASFLAGAELHLQAGLPVSGRVRERLVRAGITRLIGFPLLYANLAETPKEEGSAFSGLRMAVSAGAPLPAAVKARFEAVSGTPLVDYYGIAEVGPCTFPRDDAAHGLGPPLPGVIIDAPIDGEEPGEVRVRTASMATRYLNAPGALEARIDERGFYRTGDLGRLERGCLALVGRLDGPINLAGRKIDPLEIEHFVRTLPGVADAAAFADADSSGATIMHLAVVGSGLDARGVREACLRELAPYKAPSIVSFVVEIPRSSAGKVRRERLLDLITAQRESADTHAGSLP